MFLWVRNLLNMKKRLKRKFDKLQNENKILSNQVIDLRLKMKRLHDEKINVIFVCYRPAVWRSMKSVYEYFDNSNEFNVAIVTIPQVNAKGEFDDEDSEEFFKNYQMIKGFDKVSGTFIDLKKLNPDYIFFQQPYNSIYPSEYRSDVVSKYAKLCYLSYFTFMDNLTSMWVNSSMYPVDYLKDVSLFFAQNENEKQFVLEKLKGEYNLEVQIFVTGNPKNDGLDEYRSRDSDIWSYKEREGHFRVIWTPRWTTSENSCHFFDYKDKLLDYCMVHSDIDFVFRPHPQTWFEFQRTGEFTEKEIASYKKRYEKLDNATIDSTAEYLNSFWHSDCLISDTSTTISQYFLTEKPIIYCYRNKSKYIFERTGGFSEGLYWVENWNELEKTLSMLMSGTDPLKEKRKQIINDYFMITSNVGNRIGEIILNDAKGFVR